jgi:transcriptional regulator with XRE-family HTH domain
MLLGDRIQELRGKRRINRTELARRSGMSLSYLNEIERDLKSPTIAILQKICEALGVSLSEFFAINGEVIESLPDDLKSFILDPQNHVLIKSIQGMKDKGLSNEAIAAWLDSLSATIRDVKKRIAEGETGIVVFADDMKGKYSPEELDGMKNKFKEKLANPDFKPPWRKK